METLDFTHHPKGFSVVNSALTSPTKVFHSFHFNIQWSEHYSQSIKKKEEEEEMWAQILTWNGIKCCQADCQEHGLYLWVVNNPLWTAFNVLRGRRPSLTIKTLANYVRDTLHNFFLTLDSKRGNMDLSTTRCMFELTGKAKQYCISLRTFVN